MGVHTNKRMTFQMQAHEDDGGQTGRLFRPRIGESGNRVVRVKGYELSAGLVTASSISEGRHTVYCHLGSKVQTFDSNAEPNVAMHRFSWFNTGTGVDLAFEQRTGWQKCDLVLPFLFASLQVSGSSTTSPALITGNVEYKWEDVSDDELAELLLHWEIESSALKDKTTLRPSLQKQNVRAGGITRPYFLVNSSEQA